MKTKRFTYTGLCLVAVILLSSINSPVDARPQYKGIIGKLKPATEAEKSIQAAVKKASCKHCHVGTKDKKTRTAYGMKFHDGLGGGDKAKFKFDKKFWSKKDTKYTAEAIQLVRQAIKFAAKPKPKG
jgi:hypothetical protein